MHQEVAGIQLFCIALCLYCAKCKRFNCFNNINYRIQRTTLMGSTLNGFLFIYWLICLKCSSNKVDVFADLLLDDIWCTCAWMQKFCRLSSSRLVVATRYISIWTTSHWRCTFCIYGFAVIKKQQHQIVYTHAMISFSFYAIAQLRINSKPNNKWINFNYI